MKDFKAMADAADQMIRDRLCDTYEILYDEAEEGFIVAAPADDGEGGRTDQPTAVFVCYRDEAEDAEELYRKAAAISDKVDELAGELE